jgi:hypothetical protein
MCSRNGGLREILGKPPVTATTPRDCHILRDAAQSLTILSNSRESSFMYINHVTGLH